MGYIVKNDIRYSVDPNDMVASLADCKTLSDDDKILKYPSANVIDELNTLIAEKEKKAKQISVYKKGTKIIFKNYDGNENILGVTTALKLNSKVLEGNQTINVAAKKITSTDVNDFVISIVEIPKADTSTTTTTYIYSDVTKYTDPVSDLKGQTRYVKSPVIACEALGLDSGMQTVSTPSYAGIYETVTPEKTLKNGKLEVTGMVVPLATGSDLSKVANVKMKWNLYYIPGTT